MRQLFVIIFALSSLFFVWCKQNIIEQNTPSTSGLDVNLTEIRPSIQILTWNILSWAMISWSNYFVSITWGHLIYSGLFSIMIPKNLQIRTNKYQWAEIIRLDLEKDSLPDSRTKWYFKFYVENIPSRKKENNDKDKCILGEYDEWVIFNKTITKTIDDKTVFITKLTYYVAAAPELDIIEKKWEQWDLCFLNNDIIYRVSVWSYDKIFIQKILDSFQFIR